MPITIDANSALSRSRNHQSDELEEYRYLAEEVALLGAEVSQTIKQAADIGETSTIYNFATKNKQSDKEILMKAKLLCEELHCHGFNTSIFFDEYEADYPAGYRVVIMWG